MNGYLEIGQDIEEALNEGAPVVALESTLISHGFPYPQNVETAQRVERLVRAHGAVPATIAVMDGRIKIGLGEREFERLGQARDVFKLNAADIPMCLALREAGSTTVAATMYCAELAGIRIVATGGIGGVHHDFADTLDVSHDLQALARYNVAVVTAGAKAILDLPKTLEYLETYGVPVVGYGTEEFPAFWTRHSGLPLNWQVDTPQGVARILKTKWDLGQDGGVVVANPVPEDQAADPDLVEAAVRRSIKEVRDRGVTGKAVTPFMLKRVRELSAGASLAPNIALLENNVKLGAAVAKAFAEAG